MTMVADVTVFPWEEVDALVREQAEQEVWSDAEHDAWLEALTADQMASIDGSDPMYERWLAEGAPRSGGWSQALLAGEVEVLPDWQRDDYVGS